MVQDSYYLVRDYKCRNVDQIDDLKNKIQPGDIAIKGTFYQKGMDVMEYYYKFYDSSLNEIKLEINKWKITFIRHDMIICPTCLVVDLKDPLNKPINFTISGTGESAITELLSKFKNMSSYDNWWHYHYNVEVLKLEKLIGELKEKNQDLLAENYLLKNKVKEIGKIINVC